MGSKISNRTQPFADAPKHSGFGEGAELRRPLAIAVIFGLSFATVLTLVVVPVLYQGLAGMRGERVRG